MALSLKAQKLLDITLQMQQIKKEMRTIEIPNSQEQNFQKQNLQKQYTQNRCEYNDLWKQAQTLVHSIHPFAVKEVLKRCNILV